MIYVIEPFLTSSHQHWLNLFSAKNGFECETFTLGGYHWKWRMHGAAITMAEKLAKKAEPDHIIISDMCDVAVFKALLPRNWRCKISLYFHENQLTFPWSPSDLDLKLKRNNHYAFINFTSALAADSVIFNSHFHKTEFLSALPDFLKQFPDEAGKNSIKIISDKSSVIPIHISITPHNEKKWEESEPLILWNHRWEYDKNPEAFFETMFKLKHQNLNFKLAVLGSKGKEYPKIFDQAKTHLTEEITHFGFLENAAEYAQILSKAHITPVTSNQDFFGISALEAVVSGVYPLLPNRLVFPEHFSSSQHLYDTDEELASKLIQWISNWNLERENLKHQARELRTETLKKYSLEFIISEWKKHLHHVIS